MNAGINAEKSRLKTHHTPQGGMKAWSVFQSWKNSVGLLVLAFFSVSLLSGCGFHLRGYDAPQKAQFNTIKLTGLETVSQEIKSALTEQLNASGVIIVSSLAGAELELKLQKTYLHRSKTSYTGTGDVASVLIALKQEFSVEEVATERLLLTGEAATYRDHQIDNAALLASDRELQEINQQMATEVVRQIVDQINRRIQAQP